MPRSNSTDETPAGLGPLPLVLGVTGHRDIREHDRDKLAATLRKAFTTLKTAYPSTPIILISGLAEGADRLAAHVAGDLGIALVVPIPFAREEYERDFELTGSLDEFRELLGRASHSFELPMLPGVEVSDLAARDQRRDQHYAQLGAYIATHAQILFALWDGVEHDKMGGTSMVVHYKLQGVPEPYIPAHSPLDAAESGPVYHVVTPRASNPATNAHVASLRIIYPPGYDSKTAAKHAFDDIYERIELFNRDALRHADALESRRQKSQEYLLHSDHRAGLDNDERHVLKLYTVADALAIKYQRATHTTLRALLTLVFVGAFFLDLYAHAEEKQPMILIPYLAAFLVAFVWYTISDRGGYQSKYLDYRAFAEGLRVQFFWLWAGITESVPDYYMRKQKSELDWIRHGIRSSHMMRPFGRLPGDAELRETKATKRETRLKRVEQLWVIDQAKYFERAHHRDHRKMKVHEQYVTLFFAMGLVAAGLQLFVEPTDYILVFITLAPVLAALIGAYIEKNALAEHTKQYERMSSLFTRAKHHLHTLLSTEDLDAAEKLLIELGKEALIENGDWLLTHRERPIEVPKGA